MNLCLQNEAFKVKKLHSTKAKRQEKGKIKKLCVNF